MTAPDHASDRETLAEAILDHICNVSNLPDWMQTPALGQNMRPLAEMLADALLAAGFRGPETVAQIEAAYEGASLAANKAQARAERAEAERDGLRAKIAAVEALASEWERRDPPVAVLAGCVDDLRAALGRDEGDADG